MMRRASILGLIAAMMLALVSTTFTSSANAATGGSTVGPIDFENYNTGNINTQQSWTKTGPYDVEVAKVSDFGDAAGYGFGAKTLRASNTVTSGSFGDQTFSPGLTPGAGETALPYFTAGFKIGTAKAAEQPGLVLSVSPDDGAGGRMSYLRFVDSSDGVHVLFDDVTNPGPLPGVSEFNELDIATLDRAHSHSVEFAITFVPGAGNDVVDIFLDGALAHTGTTWENYFRFDPEQTPTGNTVPTVTKMLFRAGGAAAPAPVKGFLIDGVSLSSSRVVPASNHDLQGACGLNFVLVLDRSGSVQPSQDKVKGAATAFLEALKDTGSSVALVSFAETATVDAEPTPLTSGANLTLLKAKIGGLHFSGSTNWDDALVKADSQLPGFGAGSPPLVVMITDGNPNKWGAGRDTHGSGSGFDQEALNQAVDKANHIKTDGEHHMFALGISGGNDPLNPGALRAISGHDEYPNARGVPFAATDWTQIEDFDQLQARLLDIASELCGGTVIVQKLVNHKAAGGWDFTASGMRSHDTKDHGKSAHGTTDDDGFVTFEIEHSGHDVETAIYEDQKPGFGLEGVVCMKGDDEVGKALQHQDGVSLKVGPRDTIHCTFDNQSLPAGAIALAKSVDHPTVRSGATVTYTYTVTNPGHTELKDVAVTDDKCSPLAMTAGGDTDTDSKLDVGETWVYTCSMAITEDTTNIGTATGKTPWGEDVMPFHDTLTVDVVGTAMTLVKTGPAMAHAGDTVTYGFTVTNTGDTTLENIAVADDKLGAVGVVPSLAPGASVTLTKDYVVLADQVADVVNRGSACAEGATDALGQPLCAQGQHTLDVLHPAITIDKTANPLKVVIPNSVTFTYVVKNTGDIPLSGLVVTDDRLGAVTTVTTGVLGVGETQTFTKTMNASATSPTHNVGTATATDPLGRSVTANDPADIEVTEVLGAQLTNPSVLPITGAGLRNVLLGFAVILLGGLLLAAGRRKRTA